MKLKFNQPLPETTKRIMLGLKMLIGTVATFSYFQDHKGLAFFALVSGALIDFIVDTLIGEHPLITIEKAAKQINEEIPHTVVEYKVYKDDEDTNPIHGAVVNGVSSDNICADSLETMGNEKAKAGVQERGTS